MTFNEVMKEIREVPMSKFFRKEWNDHSYIMNIPFVRIRSYIGDEYYTKRKDMIYHITSNANIQEYNAVTDDIFEEDWIRLDEKCL